MAIIEFYTLSLHDALPIYRPPDPGWHVSVPVPGRGDRGDGDAGGGGAASGIVRAVAGDLQSVVCGDWVLAWRSEEHTSELQSQSNFVCRLLLEKINTLMFV